MRTPAGPAGTRAGGDHALPGQVALRMLARAGDLDDATSPALLPPDAGHGVLEMDTLMASWWSVVEGEERSRLPLRLMGAWPSEPEVLRLAVDAVLAPPAS